VGYLIESFVIGFVALCRIAVAVGNSAAALNLMEAP
jgi:hypothetical protein